MYHKSQEEKELILKLMGEVYDNKFWSLGEKTKEAERLCKEKIFHGQKEVLMTNDGTHALELCLRDINVQNRVVLLPVMTVPMIAWAVKRAGGTPVYVDVDYHLQMDFDHLKLRYEQYGDRIGAVILVHTGGLIHPQIFEIVEFLRERGIPMIEDMSHAQLSYLEVESDLPTYGGDPNTFKHYAGTFGDYTAFSMYATKVLSVGEGGFAAKRGDITSMKVIRNQGKNEKQEWVREGYNFRPNEWTACVAIGKLMFIEREIEHRKRMAKIYEDELAITPLHKGKMDYKEMTMRPSFYKYILPISERNEKYLTYKSGAVHRELLERNDEFGYDYQQARRVSKHHICLTLEDEEKVRKTIKELKKHL